MHTQAHTFKTHIVNERRLPILDRYAYKAMSQLVTTMQCGPDYRMVMIDVKEVNLY